MVPHMTKKQATKRVKDPWIVHPNRFAEPTVLRPVGESSAPYVPPRTAVPDMSKACVVVLPLPARYAYRRVTTGEVVFAEDSWREIAGPTLLLARSVDPDVPRFGVRFPWEKRYQWWDGTSSADHVLDRDGAPAYLRPWLELIYPDATGPIQVIDQRRGIRGGQDDG